jgi:hypothetical protein
MAYDLRPLTLGELLDRAWNLYRHHLLLFVGILAIPSIAMLIMSIVMQFLQPDMPSPDSTEAVDSAQMIGAFVWMGVGAVILGTVYWISYAIALGATTVAVAELYRGRVPSISASYDGVRGRWGRLAWLILLLFLRIFGVTFLVILVSGVMAALLGFLSPIVGALRGLRSAGRARRSDGVARAVPQRRAHVGCTRSRPRADVVHRHRRLRRLRAHAGAVHGGGDVGRA